MWWTYITSNLNLAQLWKIDENGKLVNKNVTNWKYRDKNCTIPGEGQESYIEIHGLDQVMELRNGLSANGTEVDFQVTNDINFWVSNQCFGNPIPIENSEVLNIIDSSES